MPRCRNWFGPTLDPGGGCVQFFSLIVVICRKGFDKGLGVGDGRFGSS